ncbi:MAG: DNA helicase II [Alphaproteobacteria bacterium MarineAlpha6_Bin4]|nr:MAG: DNA helicase II [Alphaproteobacteria bacterium MarineAlpha6_Bin4]|tara:strand:- start:1131 stop:3323 length:2193 start_codon:yes stop_codon:yes gene_type:complete
MNKEFYLKKLNEKQKEAVETLNGPVLVLAGAGTGKTRVLTTRLAHLLNKKLAKPWEILAVTFTNKAANEMKERVQSLLKIDIERMWIGTFHSSGLKILRRHAEICFLKKDFTVIDTDDQERLVKQILEANKIDIKKYTPSNVLWMIQWFKDKAIFPEDSKNYKFKFGRYLNISKLYIEYQKRLNTLNAVDFGDLLLLPVKVFKKNLEVLEKYQNQFKYILVDEYQDTDICQDTFLKLLCKKHKNICCVGDDDQAIYSWRGADVKNILNFPDVFKEAKIIRLEQNYRSTDHILSAASKLIENNKDRLGKTLWTDSLKGEKLKVSFFEDGKDEAKKVSLEIEKLKLKKRKLDEIAILVRASFQTRLFEDRLLKIGIPYRVIGGFRFYERLEIRDAIAYFRIVHKNNDDLAFERVFNTPKRGLGTVAFQTLFKFARDSNMTLIDASKKIIETDELTYSARNSIKEFIENINKWKSKIGKINHIELAKIILEESGYTKMWLNDKSIDSPGRLENLKELISALRDFSNMNEFLEHISLVMENERNYKFDMVNIMTMHAAKGLEFENIFLAGWDEGLFPHQKSLEEKGNKALEEERRLAYVGITRGKNNVYISFAKRRFIHGTWNFSQPSRFLSELPKENIETNEDFFEEKENFIVDQDEYEKRIKNPNRLLFKNKNLIEDRDSYESEYKFKIGDEIFHDKYGYGTIKYIVDGKYEIIFDKYNETKIVLENFIKHV